MNEPITEFLANQTCASLCCIDKDGNPYCFSCFFAFDDKQGLLFFKSSPQSWHGSLIAKNPAIAGTILPDKLSRMVIKGVQFEGNILAAEHPLTIEAAVLYHKKFPMALVMTGRIYTIEINNIKMTDSSKLFGKKESWEKSVSIQATTLH